MNDNTKETPEHEELQDDKAEDSAKEKVVEILGEEELDQREKAPEEDLDESQQERLEKLVAESDERYLRLSAEYENYRKRTAKEKEAIYPEATCQAVARFLPILDNFQRALEYDPQGEEFSKGIDQIRKSFEDTLESMGVEAYGAVGDPFDPEIHNAVMHVEDPDLGENVVAQVLQCGYRLGDRIVRHAVVQTAN